LELLRTVKHKLDKTKQLDLFVVAGDTFDMKEYLSSDTVKLYFNIMKELFDMTREYDTQFRFIEGTSGHDAKQLETLEVICDQILDKDRIRFIHTVDTESFKGMDILYLPEEYVVDSNIYYKEYFSRHYDFIFGHGPTSLMWYMKGKNTVEHSSATVFDVDQLCEIGNYCYFGHWHYNKAAGPDGRFKSIGPVSRWEFDKDGPCGMYFTWYDTSTKLAFEEYLENEYAPILPTVAISIKKEVELDELNNRIRQRINKKIDGADKLRLLVVIDSSLPNFITIKDFIMSSFGNTPKVHLMMDIVNKEDTENEEDINLEEVTEKKIEERPYLYDKTMRNEARIASYIKRKNGANIPLENILEVINPKDNRIKSREE